MWVPLDQSHDLCVAITKWATLHRLSCCFSHLFWILLPLFCYFRSTNGFHVCAYISILLSNKSRMISIQIWPSLSQRVTVCDEMLVAIQLVRSVPAMFTSPWVLYSCERSSVQILLTCQDRFVDEMDLNYGPHWERFYGMLERKRWRKGK